MKKFLSLALVLVMALTLSVSVFAGTTTLNDTDPTTTGDLPVKVATTLTTPDVYSVTVAWDELSFTYNATKTWQPADHSYAYSGEWAGGKNTATVTVTNHSNVAVEIDATITNTAETVPGISVDMTNKAAGIDLNAGVEGHPETADAKVFTVEATATPANIQDVTETTVANVKITLN